MLSEGFWKTYSERAVNTCASAMATGKLKPFYVNKVLDYSSADVTKILPFLESRDEFIRRAAIRIVAKHGDAAQLVQVALNESDVVILGDICEALSKHPDLVERLADMIIHSDEIVRDHVIQMFRKSKRIEFLTPLLFSSDNGLVSQVQKYMEEANG